MEYKLISDLDSKAAEQQEAVDLYYQAMDALGIDPDQIVTTDEEFEEAFEYAVNDKLTEQMGERGAMSRHAEREFYQDAVSQKGAEHEAKKSIGLEKPKRAAGPNVGDLVLAAKKVYKITAALPDGAQVMVQREGSKPALVRVDRLTPKKSPKGQIVWVVTK